MSEAIDISVVIPAKNEAVRLPPFLQSLIYYCTKSRLRYEIIVVDDGSTDETAAETLSFQKTFPGLVLMSLGKNYGKGHAVKQGLLASHGNIALFMDADGSTPATEIEKNLIFFQQGYDIVIGSRVLRDAETSVKALAHRRHMGAIFNFLVSALLIKGIKDTQCGFKMFRREIIQPLWKQVEIPGFGFDLEVLYVAQQTGLSIKEVPVNWKHIDNSKIDMLKDSWRMLMDIFEIRSHHRK